jgi:hypothetical protein
MQQWRSFWPLSSIIFSLPPLFIHFHSAFISLYCYGLVSGQDFTVICIAWLRNGVLTSREEHKLQVPDFRLSQWLTIDINSALGCLYLVDMRIVADVSEVHGLTVYGR